MIDPRVLRLRELEQWAPNTWCACSEYAEIARSLWPDLDPFDDATLRLAIALLLVDAVTTRERRA